MFIGVALICLEIVIPTFFVFLILGVITMIVGILALFIVNIFHILLVWIILFLLGFWIIKKVKNRTSHSKYSENIYLGQSVEVISILQNSYRVKVYDEEWSAHCSTPLEVGDRAVITKMVEMEMTIEKL